MLSIAVPGSSVPGPAVPDIVVLGANLDIVDALLTSGLSNVVLACSTDALRHAMSRAGFSGTTVLIDARHHRVLPALLRTHRHLFERSNVVIWGDALDRENAVESCLRSLVWCSAALTPSAVAGLAASHMSKAPEARAA